MRSIQLRLQILSSRVSSLFTRTFDSTHRHHLAVIESPNLHPLTTRLTVMGSQTSKSDLPEVMTDAELAALQLDANPSARVPIVYTDAYNIGFMGLEKLHPFDSKKYFKVYARLTASGEGGLLRKDELHVPLEATQRLLRIVHPQEYLDSLTSSIAVAKILEVPPLAMSDFSAMQKPSLAPRGNEHADRISRLSLSNVMACQSA